jgi:CheY-like chemotaxis protein
MANPNRILVGDDFFLRTEAGSDEEVIFLDRLLNLADTAFRAEERSSRIGSDSSERAIPQRRRLRVLIPRRHARHSVPISMNRRNDSRMLGRVLLVDDHPAVRRTLRALLTEVSVGVCGEAENGRQAIDKASELQPDVVVLDLVMPEMNGLEAGYEIRQRAPCSKIILLSLHYSPEDGLALAKALGADAFVHKSALTNDFIPAIGRMLSAKIGKREAALRCV